MNKKDAYRVDTMIAQLAYYVLLLLAAYIGVMLITHQIRELY